jgi:hypothetical protein
LELENERLQKHLVAVLSGGDPTLGPQALPAAQGETTLNPEGPPASDAMGGESSLLQGLGLRRALRRRLQR